MRSATVFLTTAKAVYPLSALTDFEGNFYLDLTNFNDANGEALYSRPVRLTLTITVDAGLLGSTSRTLTTANFENLPPLTVSPEGETNYKGLTDTRSPSE